MGDQAVAGAAEGSIYAHYPSNIPVGYEPTLKQKIVHLFEWSKKNVDYSVSQNCGPALPIAIRAAWSIVLSQYSGSNEIVFGTTPDRHGPKFPRRIVPLMVKVDWQSNTSAWVQTIESCIKETESSATRGGGQSVICTAINDTTRFSNILIIEDRLAEADASTVHDDDFDTPTALLTKCAIQDGNRLEMQLLFDTEILHQELVEHMLHQLQLILHQLCQENNSLQKLKLKELNTVSEQSKALIWSWNSKLPHKIHDWIPNLFAHQVLTNPEHTAVHAWDGRLTYAELDYKSTMLGRWLLLKKVAGSRIVLPICFDKTLWTTIALLAAAKIGATFIMIDPYQPRGRLASILSKFEHNGMLAQTDTYELAQSLTAKPVHIVNDELLAEPLQSSAAVPQNFCPGSPTDPLYIVFTSGSTGEPKGITISHYNLSSAVGHQARTLGFAGSRSFDSSSYSFDAYVCNTFHTLLTGGCLCVPSEYDRINNLEAVLQEMQVDFVQLTPSTASVLDPAALPLLRTLILTGEKITKSVLDPWLLTKRVRVINAYGPSECTIMCAANTSIACIEDAATIGRGLGATLWIADVNNVERLAPVGAVGELLIEGPIIGQGYLGDEQRTAQSLVRIPGGFLSGIAPCPEGSLFRTGDLAQYNMDGSIRFIGRADTQIKINGQRVEIGEVEHRLSQFLPEECTAIVEAVERASGKKQLVGFIHGANTETQTMRTMVYSLNENLLTVLPAYMVPSAYFPLEHIPKTSSGKTDRRTLRMMALNAPKNLIDAYGTSTDPSNKPLTETEISLRAVWAETLALDEAKLRSGDNFFSCGGDSLAAIRTVAALNRTGKFRASVADIFQHPRLYDLARTIERSAPKTTSLEPSSIIPAFSLLPLPHDSDALRAEAATLCSCNETDIEDIYPCSPVQEEMIVLASRNPEGFVTQKMADLSPDVTLTQIISSVKNLVSTLPILRTRIIESSIYGERLVQVVVKDSVEPSIYASAQSCLQHELQNDMGLGKTLFRISLVDSPDRDSICLILTMHHAVYDGWTLNLISEELSRACTGENHSGTLEYKSFINHLQSIRNDDSASFWSRALKDTTLVHYPPFLEPDYKPISTAVFEKTISGINWKSLQEATPTTLVHAAWAMTLSKLSGSKDIVYGTTLLGRQAPLVDIERLAGPTLASIPFRAFVGWGTMNIAQFLRLVQQQLVDTIPFMHYGIRNIQKLGYDADLACRFRTFLVIQPEERSSPADNLKLGTGRDDIGAFNSYAMMMECSLTADGCILRSSFDENVLSNLNVQSSVEDFAKILELLVRMDQSVPLAQLPFLDDDELGKLTSDDCMYGDQSLQETSKLFNQSCSHLFSDSAIELIETDDLKKQLVGFLCSDQTTIDHALLQELAEAQAQLAHKVPRHMLPTQFLAVRRLPKNDNGSINKTGLAALAHGAPTERFISASSLQQQMTLRNQPQTDAEIMLQDIWASTLGLTISSIGRESSFLQLGGDSLSAMKVVSAARKQGYHFTVAELFRSPCLVDIARKAKLEQTNGLTTLQVKPFSLVKHGVDKQKLAFACGLDPSLIEDAYPCSPLQEAMMAKTIRDPGAYVSKNVFKLDDQASVTRLQKAWNAVAATAPILRTRIVESDGYGLLQVVTAGGVAWTEHRDTSTLPPNNMALGEALMRFDVVKNDSGVYLHSMVHHAVHDRWSAALILEQVEQAYEGKPFSLQLLPYNYFIRHILEGQSQQHIAQAYWRNHFADLEAPDFPRLPTATYRPKASSFCTKRLSVQWPEHFTPTTVLKAAFALLISQYSDSNDVLFDVTLLGRQSALAGVDLIAGPTITTIPLRSKIDQNATAAEHMKTMQAMAIEMIPFEHYGLAQIQRISPEAKRACQAQASLVVQPPERDATSNLFGLQVHGADERVANEQAFALECTLQAEAGQVLLNLNFDDQVVNQLQAERMLAQLEYILRELGRVDLYATHIHQLAQPNNDDLQELRNWNAKVASNEGITIAGIIAAQAQHSPDSIAIEAWDMSLTYIELYSRAQKLAYFLVTSHGVGKGNIVPICLEKSVFAPVAMLAVILTGGAAVTMDPAQPAERLAGIMHTVRASIVLASPSTAKTLHGPLSSNILCMDRSSVLGLPKPPPEFTFPVVSDEDPLYINFTSGSTGAPKGAIVTHGNCSAAVLHQAAILGFNQDTRAIDLSSYSFDVVWELLLQVLCTGGCLCIPSDNDRFNNISNAIQRFKVNLLDITPSLARTLTPQSLPMVRRIIFGGEVLALDDISPWDRCGVQVLNTYGPSECTPTATIARHGIDFTDEMTLGRCYGLTSWIVSCDGNDNLVPIGGVGELVLEGPLVGNGYLNDEEKTKKAFLHDFAWFRRVEVDAASSGRRRFYKTGDMVRYNSQGLLVFEGRRDTQVKIRGQRVELDEVEFQSRVAVPEHVSVVAEVITAHTASSNTSQLLALFMDSETALSDVSKSAIEVKLRAHLSKALPAYMVPSLYIFTAIPRTVSGKVDRRQLREQGSALRSERLENQLQSIGKPETPCERVLSQLWAATLGVDEENIGRETSFLDLGGDSLTAIRLVGAARENDLPLTVALVFQAPQLRGMALAVTAKKEQLLNGDDLVRSDDTHSAGFSDLEEDLTLPSRDSVSKLLSVPAEVITDILPLTDFQKYAVRCALSTPRTEWNYISVRLPQSFDALRLAEICVKMTDAVDILRCIFVPFGHRSYAQVFLSCLVPQIQTVSTENSLDSQCELVCLEDWKAEIPALTSLVKFFILKSETCSDTRLLMRIPHAQYDGLSFDPLCEVIRAICDNRDLPPLSSFASYVKEVAKLSESAHVFWKTLLAGSIQTSSLSMPQQLRREPSKRHYERCQVSVSRLPQGITPATMFYAAWGMTVSKMTGALDIIFGRAVSGRAMPTSRSRHDNVIGPCINLVPTRIVFDQSLTRERILRKLQEQIIESIEHENLGLSDIVRKCTQWKEGATMGSVVYFQNLASVDKNLPQDENTVQLEAIALERPDPPEPPRLDITPLGAGQYGLELMIPEEEASAERVGNLLRQMEACLQELQS